MVWQKILAEGFSTSKELLEFLKLPASFAEAKAEQQFKTRVPRSFAERMQTGNAQDPLLLQVLATAAEELDAGPMYRKDALNERDKNVLPGVLHKYHGRILLTLTGVCAVNCRFCFRRHFPYEANNPGKAGWQAAIDYVRANETIHEIIFSGGDPLLAADSLLGHLLQAFAQVPHVKTIRFHTRIPIVLPERITENFLAILKNCSLSKVMVLHCNHAQEINKEVQEVCADLRAAGCHLLNQSVLLKGINDQVESLVELSEKLFESGVLPYYLHLLDKISGTAHFDLPEEAVLKLYRQLQSKLPGYLLPRLSREEAGKASKTLLI